MIFFVNEILYFGEDHKTILWNDGKIGNDVQNELFNQTFGPVKWVDTINKLAENGVEKIYEIGPGSVLKGMIKKINGNIEVVNVSKLEDLAGL